MKASPVEAAVKAANQNYPRLMRLYRYLRDNGRCERDRIMIWTGFPSPKDEPVRAYVAFANTIIRLDAVLRRHGKRVAGGFDHGQVFWIEAME